MTNEVLMGKPNAENPRVAPTLRYGGTGRLGEGDVAPMKTRRGFPICKKFQWIVGIVLGFALCASAATRTWTGAGDGIRWGDAANWDAAVQAQDALSFTSDTALVTSNDLGSAESPFVLTKIICTGSGSVTLLGNPVAFASAGQLVTNGCPLTVSLDFQVPTGDSSFCHTAVFKHLGCLSKSTGTGYFYLDNKVNTKTTGCGCEYNTVYMPKGTILIRSRRNEDETIFNGKVTATKLCGSGTTWRGTIRMRHADNEIANCDIQMYRFYTEAENCIGTNAFVRLGYADTTLSVLYMNADQTIDRLGQVVYTAKADDRHLVGPTDGTVHTLTLRASQNCETDARFKGNLTLVWDPLGDYTFKSINFSHTNTMTGAIIVRRGTFQVNDKTQYAQATAVSVASGARFEVLSTATEALPCVQLVTLASGARMAFTADNPKPISPRRPHFALATGAKLEIPTGITLQVRVSTNGVNLAKGGRYTGSDNATPGEATPCDWIEGPGEVVVDDNGEADYWIGGTGTWHTAEQWSSDVPTATIPVRIYATDLAPSHVTVTAPAVAKSVQISAYSELSATMAVSNTVGVETSFTLGNTRSAGEVGATVGDGGMLLASNITIGTASGKTCTLAVHDGGSVSATRSSDFFTLAKTGRLVMTGGTFTLNGATEPAMTGGEIDLSGDAQFLVNVTGFRAILKTLTLRISDQAVFKQVCTSQTRWYFSPNNTGEECRIELDDDGQLVAANDAMTVCHRSGAKTLVTMRGRSVFKTGNGFAVGSGAGATGEIVMYDNAYLEQDYYNYSADFGLAGSVAAPARGILRMHGGRFYTGRKHMDNRSLMRGLIFGNGLSSSESGSVAEGTFEMTDGVITNKSYGVFAFGAGMATGTGTQSGGFICQLSAEPVLIGFRGGTGYYDMSGGRLLANGHAFVGGAQTNVINYYLAALADRPGTGRLTVSGGSFEVVQSLYVSAGGYGTLEIGPSGTVQVGADLFLTNCVDAVAAKTACATLKFTAGATGSGCVKVAKKLHIAPGAKLIVDMSAFTGVKSFPLVEAASVEGSFASANVEIVSTVPQLYSVRQRANELRLMVTRGTCLILR